MRNRITSLADGWTIREALLALTVATLVIGFGALIGSLLKVATS